MFHGYLPAILEGLGLTLRLAAASLAIACLFGIVGAVAKLSGNRWAQALATGYTTLIRGVPELVLMLLTFYGGQALVNYVVQRAGGSHVDVDAFVAGSMTVGFIFGAYLTETFRGAILAVPRGQIEAGYAFGMSFGRTLWRITLPQMVRHALPGFINNWLVMIKATALVSIIGLDDMLHRAGLASAATREPFTFYMLIALIYLSLTSVSLAALWWVERRFSRGVRRVQMG
jgi:His/Glu/Gln/Arg/opine family amino acid ABC transporter permease subunit